MAKGGWEWTIAHVQIKNDDVVTKSLYLINLAKRNDKWWPICLYIYQSHPFRNSWIQPATFLRIPVREITKVDEYSREAKVSVVFFWGALRLLMLFFCFKQFSDRAKTIAKQQRQLAGLDPVVVGCVEPFKIFLFFDHMHQDGPTWRRPSPAKSGEPLLKKSNGLHDGCLTASSEFEASNPCAVPATCVNTNLQTIVSVDICQDQTSTWSYGICVFVLTSILYVIHCKINIYITCCI